jgi:GMP reductase
MNYYKKLKYSDVCLVPKFSACASRRDCNTRVTFPGTNDIFRLPVMPANMRSVIDRKIAKWMSDNSYFYSMHRFKEDVYNFVECANKESWKTISISVGVKDQDIELIRKISSAGLRVDYLTVDIAHGHSERMKRMLYTIRQKASFCVLGNCSVIAGNVSTQGAVRDLYSWGANVIKIGIGQGSPCTTKDKTGFTLPMFSCVLDCGGIYKNCSEEGKIPIIADGGIKHTGDIAKAIRAGAFMTMAGGIFAECKDSPAETTTSKDGKKLKAYFGSASIQNKIFNKNIEGVQVNLNESNVTYKKKLEEIEQDLQSAISYAGGGDLSSLKTVSYEAIA